jgi:DNA-binding NarL/FixJ family response regulator
MCTVFILYNHSLFARGLEQLLQENSKVKITGVEASGEKAFARIEALKPDVVIVEAEQEESGPEMLLSRFLHEQLKARMVRLSLKDNSAIVYCGRRCEANTAEDLVKAVLSSQIVQQ